MGRPLERRRTKPYTRCVSCRSVSGRSVWDLMECFVIAWHQRANGLGRGTFIGAIKFLPLNMLEDIAEVLISFERHYEDHASVIKF